MLAAALGANADPLADEQRAWAASHPQIRFAPERDFGPFVYQSAEGAVAGLSIDMLDAIARNAGLDIRTLEPRALHEQLDAMRRGEVDLLSSLRPTPERAAFLDFTLPYVSVPTVLAVRTAERAEALDHFDGKRVAVGQGYAVENVVRARFPHVDWQPVSDDAVALRGLAQGRFDAVVVDVASFAFVEKHEHLQGLKVAKEVGFEYELSFAVRKDWPELRAILDHGIRTMPPAQRQQVLDRWLAPLTLKRSPVADATWIGLVLVAFGTLVAGIAWLRARARAELP